MQLKIVLLPEPFGPIRPRISPSLTANETSWTARKAPNRFESPDTLSIGMQGFLGGLRLSRTSPESGEGRRRSAASRVWGAASRGRIDPIPSRLDRDPNPPPFRGRERSGAREIHRA